MPFAWCAISNPYQIHIWVTPVPKIGLWTLSPRFLSSFTSPWAHDPFFLLASDFPFQITWLPVPWAHDSFFQLVSGFPFQITWLPVAWACDPFFFLTGQRFPPLKNTWLPVPVMTSSLHQNEAHLDIRAYITTVMLCYVMLCYVGLYTKSSMVTVWYVAVAQSNSILGFFGGRLDSASFQVSWIGLKGVVNP